MTIAAVLVGGSAFTLLATGDEASKAQAASTQPKAVGSSAPVRTVTMVTGDQVTVSRDPIARLSVKPGKGRAGIGFLTTWVKGHLHVVPRDAQPLVLAGRLDGRLFDVTLLIDSRYDDRRGDLPLIMSYASGSAVQTAARRRTELAGGRLDSAPLGGDKVAVQAPKREITRLWNQLKADVSPARGVVTPVQKIWLDGWRQPALDVSGPQIGVATAWRAGLTGAGVKVAVLDSGVDHDHPDLDGRVIKSVNFTDGEEDARDLAGHGTHVASILAGSGAASGGRYKGVAPDARLLDGKVCTREGCAESWILAGMHWAAVEQQAKIVNLSLGGTDSSDLDPIEGAVDELTERHGVLFVVAAGNEGPGEGTIGSPASADSALAVGAVDRADAVAGFSSRGPLTAHGAVKPDLAGPGVEITAARSADSELGSPGESYTTLSGTSMATPHVAGAAAILAQQHPGWTPGRLKAVLMASAAHLSGVPASGQGTGRVDLGAAIQQSWFANSTGINLGLQQWPHGDDQPAVRQLTYQNVGTVPLQLDLTIDAVGPDGRAAPAGMFSLGATKLTVQPGGTATTTITADTRLGADSGNFTGSVRAAGGGRTVRTAVVVSKEAEAYDLKLRHSGRDGRPNIQHGTVVYQVDGGGLYYPLGTEADSTLRVAPGRYVVATRIEGAAGDITQLVHPDLEIGGPSTVALDARKGQPVTVSVPSVSASSVLAELTVTVAGSRRPDGFGLAVGILGDSFGQVFSGRLGPDQPVDGLSSVVGSLWAHRDGSGSTFNSPVAFRLAWQVPGSVVTGFHRAVRSADLAVVRARYGASTIDQPGGVLTWATFDGRDAGGLWTEELGFDLPATRTEYVNSDPGLTWRSVFWEGAEFAGFLSRLDGGYQRYQAGRRYDELWNRGVLTPSDGGLVERAAFREGNHLAMITPLYSDSARRWGEAVATGRTTVHRNGELLAEQDGVRNVFEVGPERARYQVRIDAQRPAPAQLATRTTAVWSFESQHADQRVLLPLSVIRFTPRLDSRNSAPAGVQFEVPLTVYHQPEATGSRLADLSVDVSYDDGGSWQSVPVRRSGDSATVTLQHPVDRGFVSLRANARDASGGSVEQTVVRAYRLTPTVDSSDARGDR